MFLGFGTKRSSPHLKRAALMLRDAQLARMEHQAAGEHHMALAQMYAERVRRLEQELQMAQNPVQAEVPVQTASSTPLPAEPVRQVTEEAPSPVVFTLQSKERATAGR